LAAAAQAVAPAAYSAPQADAEPVMLQTGQFSLHRVLGSPFRPLWPLRLLAILRWLRPPFLSIDADRDDHSSAVAADQGRLFLNADYVSVEATPVAPERFSIIDRASLGEMVVSLATRVSRTLPPGSRKPFRLSHVGLRTYQEGFDFNESELTMLGSRSFAAETARAGLNEEEAL
jgi:hypothetical protein